MGYEICSENAVSCIGGGNDEIDVKTTNLDCVDSAGRDHRGAVLGTGTDANQVSQQQIQCSGRHQTRAPGRAGS